MIGDGARYDDRESSSLFVNWSTYGCYLYTWSHIFVLLTMFITVI